MLAAGESGECAIAEGRMTKKYGTNIAFISNRNDKNNKIKTEDSKVRE
jgi:hypothetical protein